MVLFVVYFIFLPSYVYVSRTVVLLYADTLLHMLVVNLLFIYI